MSNKEEIVVVSKEQIIFLQAGARSFRQAFYVLYDSIMKSDDGRIKFNDGDLMSVLGTIGCFSIELYIKFIMVILSFDYQKNEGKHIKCHCLDHLFDAITIRYPNEANEIVKKIHSRSNKKEFNFINFLKSIKDGFIDWRYSYSKGNLSCNLNDLSFVLNALETISNELFIPVSQSLSHNSSNKNSEECMIIDDINSIKCETFVDFYDGGEQ